MRDCLPELERWTWTLTWPWLCQLVVMVSPTSRTPENTFMFLSIHWTEFLILAVCFLILRLKKHSICVQLQKGGGVVYCLLRFFLVSLTGICFSPILTRRVIFLWPHSCFTLLWQFLLYSKVSQPHVYVCVCMHTCLVVVRLFAAPWTVARQSPPSMEFSRQEYWSRLPPGDLLDSGINLNLLHCRWILYG